MSTIIKHFFIFLFAFFFIGRISFAQQKFGVMDIPVRMTHTFGLSGNLCWNSLTGFGIAMQYYLVPKVALDGGVGISSTGYKFGIRGRYIFLKKNFSPFAGSGFIYSTGSFDQILTIEDIGTGNDITFKLLPSRFLQFVVGGDLVTNGGFFLLFDLGYAYLLNNNIDIVTGTTTQEMKRLMRIVYGSGIVFEVSIGYVFKNKGFRSRF